MTVTGHRILLYGLTLFASAAVFCAAARADEIRLKDGKKLYGVIVAYEDNMFKVKTDFGYVLVEKDKIAEIIPSTPAPATPAKPPKPAADPAPKTEPAVATSKTPPINVTNTSSEVGEANKREKPVAIVNGATSRPEIPASSAKTDSAPPAIKGAGASAKTVLATSASPPPPPKEEPSANREEIQGNL